MKTYTSNQKLAAVLIPSLLCALGVAATLGSTYSNSEKIGENSVATELKGPTENKDLTTTERLLQEKNKLTKLLKSNLTKIEISKVDTRQLLAAALTQKSSIQMRQCLVEQEFADEIITQSVQDNIIKQLQLGSAPSLSLVELEKAIADTDGNAAVQKGGTKSSRLEAQPKTKKAPQKLANTKIAAFLDITDENKISFEDLEKRQQEVERPVIAAMGTVLDSVEKLVAPFLQSINDPNIRENIKFLFESELTLETMKLLKPVISPKKLAMNYAQNIAPVVRKSVIDLLVSPTEEKRAKLRELHRKILTEYVPNADETLLYLKLHEHLHNQVFHEAVKLQTLTTQEIIEISDKVEDAAIRIMGCKVAKPVQPDFMRRLALDLFCCTHSQKCLDAIEKGEAMIQEPVPTF